MYQIPQGSIALNKKDSHDIIILELNAFETKECQFDFYFPS